MPSETSSATDFFFVSKNGAMREFMRAFQRAARTDWPVLISGEPGCGRELVARALHERSLRSHELFMKLDCLRGSKAALEEHVATLEEAFARHPHASGNGDGNGASAGNNGFGTVFFHEVTQLEPDLQARVFRLFTRDENTEAWEMDGPQPLLPRVLMSTCKDLRQEVDQGRFHRDLFFRMGAINLDLPPLRDRKDDVPKLAEHFLRKYSGSFGRPSHKLLTPAAMECLRRYDWPGNLPELASLIKRIVFLGNEEVVLAELKPSISQDGNGKGNGAGKIGLKSLAREAAQKTERDLILRVLRENQWNRKRAAQTLNVSYKTILYKIKQLGLDEA